jgi:hypothetical protein
MAVAVKEVNREAHYDEASLHQTAQLLGGVTELRALFVKRERGDSYSRNFGGYFDNPEKLVEAAKYHSELCAKGLAHAVYFIPNPVRDGLLCRAYNRMRAMHEGECTKDPQIVKRRWILIDCDQLERDAGVLASDEEHDAAIERAGEVFDYLRETYALEPGELVLADSGNGAHVLVRMDLPNTEETRDQVKGFLEDLASRFDDSLIKIDRSCFNAARLCKFYGTRIGWGDDVPRQGRVRRLSRILEVL